jgi:hypothetical protein
MDYDASISEDNVQAAHEDREHEVHEPLYGLAPEPGGGGPASVGDASQPEAEVPVEEPAGPGDDRLNMIWAIVIGGVLLLFLITIVLYFGVGTTYSSSPLSTYPLK